MLIKGLAGAWRERKEEWTKDHLRVMYALGFNLFAMQEDVIGSLVEISETKRTQEKVKEVLEMLVLFSVLSI